jgi:ABC-type multidrug transport system ATPase subunit
LPGQAEDGAITSILEAREVTKRYGRRPPVLRGASLAVQPGEIVGLTGENGSGKSTLLRIIVGLLQADGGTVAMNGSKGYCPQEPVLFDSLTMQENLAYFAAGYGLSDEELRKRSSQLFERLRSTDHSTNRVANLSGGTKQKLNLIISLLHRPALLILDEPYQGFDYESYLAFWDLVREFKEEGRSVLIVSHMLLDRDPLDRVYELREGRAVEEG